MMERVLEDGPRSSRRFPATPPSLTAPQLLDSVLPHPSRPQASKQTSSHSNTGAIEPRGLQGKLQMKEQSSSATATASQERAVPPLSPSNPASEPAAGSKDLPSPTADTSSALPKQEQERLLYTDAADGEASSLSDADDGDGASSASSDPTRALMERLLGGSTAFPFSSTLPDHPAEEESTISPSITSPAERLGGESKFPDSILDSLRLPWQANRTAEVEKDALPKSVSQDTLSVPQPQLPSVALPDLPQPFSLPSPSELASATSAAIGSTASELASSASAAVSQATGDVLASATGLFSRAIDSVVGDRTALAFGLVATGALSALVALSLTQVGMVCRHDSLSIRLGDP